MYRADEKMQLSALYCDYNKKYQQSDLKREMNKVEKEILRLQEKQKMLHFFEEMTNKEQLLNLDFYKIKEVVLQHEWVDNRQDGDGYSTNEEMYVFQVHTDVEVFSVMLEFLGEESKLQNSVYHIHAPSMEEEKMMILKKDILLKFSQEGLSNTIFTHQHTDYETELNKKFVIMECIEEYAKERYNKEYQKEKIVLLKKGKMYRVNIQEFGTVVEGEKNEMLMLNWTQSKNCFGGVFSEKSIEEKERFRNFYEESYNDDDLFEK